MASRSTFGHVDFLLVSLPSTVQHWCASQQGIHPKADWKATNDFRVRAANPLDQVLERARPFRRFARHVAGAVFSGP